MYILNNHQLLIKNIENHHYKQLEMVPKCHNEYAEKCTEFETPYSGMEAFSVC